MTLSRPAELIDQFAAAIRDYKETGEMPEWVGRHEQELTDEMAAFHESSDDDRVQKELHPDGLDEAVSALQDPRSQHPLRLS